MNVIFVQSKSLGRSEGRSIFHWKRFVKFRKYWRLSSYAISASRVNPVASNRAEHSEQNTHNTHTQTKLGSPEAPRDFSVNFRDRDRRRVQGAIFSRTFLFGFHFFCGISGAHLLFRSFTRSQVFLVCPALHQPHPQYFTFCTLKHTHTHTQWPRKRTICCSNCCLLATRALAKHASCSGSPMMRSRPHLSRPSVSWVPRVVLPAGLFHKHTPKLAGRLLVTCVDAYGVCVRVVVVVNSLFTQNRTVFCVWAGRLLGCAYTGCDKTNGDTQKKHHSFDVETTQQSRWLKW